MRATAASFIILPCLRIVALDRLVRWLSRRSSPRYPPPGFDETSIVEWVGGTLRRLPGPWRHTCLRRAAVLYYLMRRAGRAVVLCIGVRRGSSGKFEAHAWLSWRSRPYLEPDPLHIDTYTVIATFPDERAASRSAA